jgi:uncharacterized protein involved in outer membrane biogenesis
MKKLLIRIVIGLVLLIVLALLGVGLFLNSIVKKGVETIGPQLTKVEIKLDSVSLHLLTGSGSIKGLVVGNPEGYKTPQAISVGNASLSVKPGSLLSDKIVIRSIRLEAPEITFEGLPVGANNLSKILDNVNAATGGSSTNKAAPKETAAAKPGKKLELDDFLITGAKVHVTLTGLGGKTGTLPLPDIHLTDLGKDSDGITAADLTKHILSAITEGTIKAVAANASQLGKSAEEAAKGAVDKAGGAAKGVTDLFKKK